MNVSRLSEQRMLKLMAYVDGELDGAERDEVEGWLATDVEAARFAEEIGVLGGLVKVGHGASSAATAAASFDVADAVMATIKTEEGSKVSSLAAARARRQKHLKVGATAALALAASFFLMARSNEEAPMARAPVQAAEAVPSSGAGPGVDVDIVESAQDSVRVFYLSSESSPVTSVVVWVDESGGK